MFCKNCGKENPDSNVICEGCGASLTEEVVVTVAGDTTEDPGKKFGLISLITGAASVVLTILCSISSCFCTCLAVITIPLGIVAFVCAIVGIVLGVMAIKKSKAVGLKNKMAIIGIVCSGAYFIISIISGVASAIITVLGGTLSLFGGSTGGGSGYGGGYYY